MRILIVSSCFSMCFSFAPISPPPCELGSARALPSARARTRPAQLLRSPVVGWHAAGGGFLLGEQHAINPKYILHHPPHTLHPGRTLHSHCLRGGACMVAVLGLIQVPI